MIKAFIAYFDMKLVMLDVELDRGLTVQQRDRMRRHIQNMRESLVDFSNDSEVLHRSELEKSPKQ